MKPDGEKARLRREVLAAREELSPERRRRASKTVISKVLALSEYDQAGTVLGYCSFGSELDTWEFLQAALDGGKRLVLPRVDRSSNSLVLHEVRDISTDLVPGVWGIMEPDAALPEVEIEAVDFVLTPGVAFDREGGRLGYGGGYYDHLLGSSPSSPTLVAVAFEIQIVKKVPTKAHDVRVHAIVTEEETRRVYGNA